MSTLNVNVYQNNQHDNDNTCDNGNCFNNDANHFRTIHNRYDSISTPQNNQKTTIICDNRDEADISVNIFRFKFSEIFTSELYSFSKIHQYDHRKDFKIAWETWLETNSDLVKEETHRLEILGYEGDILDKMFKSARYYFRKKSTETKKPKERKNYIGSQKELLDSMDDHIKSSIKNEEYKPSNGFLDFCQKNKDVLQDEVDALLRNGITDKNEIQNKIKKTYKNRYFMIIQK